MFCFAIIIGSSILNLFVPAYEDILYHKCLLRIYVLPEDGPRRPKYLGEIIMTKILRMNIYNW